MGVRRRPAPAEHGHRGAARQRRGARHDGPFSEAKEYIGGFTVIRAADLDAALGWARKAAAATTLPVEVRPFREGY